MTRSGMKLAAVLTVLLFVSAQPGLPQEIPGEKPWEDPASGFGQSPGSVSTSDGQPPIETAVNINTSGGSKDDGMTTSKTGTNAQQSVVDNFLNDAANTIKAANGGSAWVWTWQKKWKIGPDGKTYEVTEAWQEGNINGKGLGATVTNDPPSPDTPADPASQGTPSGPTPATPGTPEIPATPGTPGTTTATKPPTSATTTPGTTPGTDPVRPADPSVPPQGFDPAPPDLPNADVRLLIQDPATQLETPYPKNVFPTIASPALTALTCKNQAVPEDTRVKISLEFEPTRVNRDDLTLTVKDNEGDTLVPPDEIGAYRHIFRIPDLTPTYTAVVTYRHPLTGKTREIIHVAIPVYALSFKTRAVEHEQSRGDSQSPAPGSN